MLLNFEKILSVRNPRDSAPMRAAKTSEAFVERAPRFADPK